MPPMAHNAKQICICLDQLCNAVFCALLIPHERVWADETLSAHAHRMAATGKRQWPQAIINFLFFWDKQDGKGHCQLSYESELQGRQLPPEERGATK
ncbi:MAG: hypothetical protein NC489_38230 [Ruminococcus flavefaciens]|nr:hypothetical protein [Ruminococcus flavefaciens]